MLRQPIRIVELDLYFFSSYEAADFLGTDSRHIRKVAKGYISWLTAGQRRHKKYDTVRGYRVKFVSLNEYEEFTSKRMTEEQLLEKIRYEGSPHRHYLTPEFFYNRDLSEADFLKLARKVALESGANVRIMNSGGAISLEWRESLAA